MIADDCLNDLDTTKQELGNGFGSLNARVRSLKGLIELVRGNADSCMYFVSFSPNFFLPLVFLFLW